MSSKQLLEALDILSAHPDIQEYIKSFDDPQDFINTINTNTTTDTTNNNTNTNTDMVKQIDNLLDPHGMYTGAMWVLLLSNIHKALKGVITREYILTQIAEEKQKREDALQKLIDKQLKEDEDEEEIEDDFSITENPLKAVQNK